MTPQRAIRAVAHGEAIFSPTVASRMMAFFSNMRPAKFPQIFPELSDWEHEVLELMVQGYRNPQIAEKLVLSPKTVRNHVSNILSKLQVVDRTQAVLKAREAGIGNQSTTIDID